MIHEQDDFVEADNVKHHAVNIPQCRTPAVQLQRRNMPGLHLAYTIQDNKGQ